MRAVGPGKHNTCVRDVSSGTLGPGKRTRALCLVLDRISTAFVPVSALSSKQSRLQMNQYLFLALDSGKSTARAQGASVEAPLRTRLERDAV